MIITFYSFLMSVLFSGIFIAGIHFLRKKPWFLRSFGLPVVLLFCLLCFVRAALIFELSFTVPLPLRGVYSAVVRHVRVTELPVGSFRVELLELYCAIWFSVAAVLCLRFFCQRVGVQRKLARYAGNKDACADRVLERVKSESWRTPSVSVCVCPSLDVPMGSGLFRRRIYLPDEKYAEDELYYILKHEYTHFCNRDLLIKFLTQLFCCVFWWNPLMLLLKKDISQILEIRCDLKATENLEKGQRAAYLLTILRILRGKEKEPSGGKLSVMQQATELVSRKKQSDIQERFMLVTKPIQPISRHRRAAFCAMALGVLFLSYTFVIQPEYDPPWEDIYDQEGVVSLDYDPEKVYLIKHKNGSYGIVLDDRSEYPIRDITAEAHIKWGTLVKEE